MLSRIRNSLYNIMVLGLTLGAVILLLLTLLLPRPEKQAAVPVQSEASAAQYLARTSGSRVVIYRTGRSEPVMVTEIDVRTLPDADQEALAHGIELADATALAHLLEDYDG